MEGTGNEPQQVMGREGREAGAEGRQAQLDLLVEGRVGKETDGWKWWFSCKASLKLIRSIFYSVIYGVLLPKPKCVQSRSRTIWNFSPACS